MPIVFEHEECGSTDIIATCWYAMNSWTMAVDMFGNRQYMVGMSEGEPPTNQIYCPKCDREVAWDELKQIDEQTFDPEWTGLTVKGDECSSQPTSSSPSSPADADAGIS